MDAKLHIWDGMYNNYYRKSDKLSVETDREITQYRF